MVSLFNKPLTLSIIIPAYNEEIYIRQCLEAIAVQTVMPDEVIVVDNNCVDKTVKFAKQYKFVKIINEPVQGIPFARNRGFNAAKSVIIGRIDADTTLPPDWVEKVKNYYAINAHQNSAITGSGYFSNIIVPPKAVSGVIQDMITIYVNRLIVGNFILWGSNMALTRKQWNFVKKDVCNDIDIHEDLDLAIHLHNAGVRIAYLPTIRVGVIMKRVLDNWTALYENLMWWPRTLRRHGKKGWVFGLLGAYILLVFSILVILLNKPWYIARRITNRSIK